MVETVADAAAFECIMAERIRRYHCVGIGGRGYNLFVACDVDGKPATPAARRAYCEMEKLALGLSEKSYIICGPVMEGCVHYLRTRPDQRAVMLVDVDEQTPYARKVTLWVGPEDVPFVDKLFQAVVRGRKLRPYTGATGGYASSGTACAYPGGCD